MENVLLIGLSRQMTLRRELDVIANNVANAQTNGFKRRLSDSQEFKMPVASDDTFRRGQDRHVSFVVEKGTPLDLSIGKIEPTNNPMDVALTSNNTFFVVQTPQGERYTRNGATMLNAQGQLVNSDGHAMVGEQGPFQFGSEERNIRFGSDGLVSSSGGPRGKLRMVKFANPQALENVGANLFTTKAQPETDIQARVQGGFLERANTNPVVEISRMIEITRQYQSIANLISRNDDLRRNAITKLGEPI
jgi:flagellar basal-body rod protein FlgF